MTQTDARVGTTAVSVKPAASRRAWNSGRVLTWPLRLPKAASITRSMVTLSQKRNPSFGSSPVGMIHSMSKSFPPGAIALRQFRRGIRASSSPQLMTKFERTNASLPAGTASKALPPRNWQRAVSRAASIVCRAASASRGDRRSCRSVEDTSSTAPPSAYRFHLQRPRSS